MYGFAQDIRFALRQLRAAPGFSLAIVLTLALGIGATTAIFSLVEGILLRPLPFASPDRLALLGDHLGNNPTPGVTAREIATYSHAASAFSSQGAYIGASYELSGGESPQAVSAARVTASLFPTLGVAPLLGRVFTQQEDDAHAPVAVLSYALWTSRFHRDPRAIGASIELDRRAYSIIGVMPRGFEFPISNGSENQTQLWAPMSLTPDELSEAAAGFWGYRIVARLKDGESFSAAVQDADRVAHQVMRNLPASMSGIHIRGDAMPLREYVVGETRPLLRTLLAAVAIVLLIACVNVAVLLLVRAIRRRREHAVRLALGARAGDLVRQAVCEGVVLSLAGGMLGLGLAALAVRTAPRLLPDSMPRIDAISIDATVAAFAILLALLTGVLCSIAPAFSAVRTDLIDSLKDGERTSSGATTHRWLRSSLVAAEIAVAMVLLTVSLALLRSYAKMLAVDPGYRSDHVLIAGYDLPLQQYPTGDAAGRFRREVVDRLAARPGVSAVGVTTILPASDNYAMAAYTIEGQPADGWKLKFAAFGAVYGGYFHALGIPLLEGRAFTANDRSGEPLVVLVNQSMAHDCWPGQSPIGKRMHVGNPKKGLPWATVIGVVGDTRLGSPDQPGGDQWYAPAEQPEILYGPDAAGKLAAPGGGFLTVRSALPPSQMIENLRETVASIDPHLALRDVRPLADAVSNVEAPRRFNTGLISAFALAALVLAIVGIYAVVAFSVSLRTREIAIRMAVGARRGQVARLVLLSGARLALLGCGFGLLASVAVSRLVRAFLFEVSPTDPLLYFAAVVLMLALALAASALPAARAAAADPAHALRSV
ncbi:MAG TPA: ABC transporter permease [Terracidiphilus sp.]|jgi:putative ABC transport system permease protein|nr:ABC transporter permease [Terracidiphilus sp.]